LILLPVCRSSRVRGVQGHEKSCAEATLAAHLPIEEDEWI
jgi:hypothetical protein